MPKRSAFTRIAALLCIALGVGLVCYQLTLPALPDYGVNLLLSPASAAGVRVTAVDPGSSAAKAGIKAGDRIFLGKTEMDRARIVYALPGSSVRVRVNGSREVTLTAPVTQAYNPFWPLYVVRFAFLFVAALLAWRRFDDTASRSLVAFLWCYGITLGIHNNVFATPLLTLFVQVLSTVLMLLGTGAVAMFAATFPSGKAQRLPGLLARIALAITVLASLIAVSFIGPAFSPDENAWVNGVVLWSMVVTALLVVATLATAQIYGAAAERRRRRWVFLLLGLTLAAVGADLGVTASVGYNQIVDQIALLPIAFMPFGLAYVILRHRVIDVGFVINRAVVYTILSIIVVGIFVVVETLLGRYVENTSHVTSMAVQLAVALVLGFSIRFVHARVDGFVDRVLFRERHLAEDAMHDFAQEASYITDADVLLSRCVKTVERYAKARGAGVWRADGTVYRAQSHTFAIAPDVDENDPAVLSMRARRVNVHVRDCESSLPGALAFPMIVRGELIGILVCGPKIDEEIYDPDEERALASLASSVGHALDTIEVRELRRQIQALTATAGSQPAF